MSHSLGVPFFGHLLEIAREQFATVQQGLEQVDRDLEQLEQELAGAAPWTPGSIPKL